MSSTQNIDAPQARGFLAEFLANAQAAQGGMGGAAGNAFAGAMGVSPEQYHEQAQQNMTAAEARGELGGQQAADADHAAAVANNAAIATDPSNPDGTPNLIVGGGGPVTLGPTPSDGSLRGFLEAQLRSSSKAQANATNAVQASERMEGSGLDDDMQGQVREKAIVAAESQLEQPLLHQRTIEAAQFEQKQKLAMDAGQKAYDAQMIRVRSAVNEANQAEMHNFWGEASTGAKILGVLAQALSGAANGLAGNPSAITPLDRLIEQDMQRQQANMQQKNKAAYREQGMLSTIQKQTGDRLAALNAMKVAAWDRIDKQVAELKGTIAGPVAEAQSQSIQGLAKQRKAQFTEKLQQRLLDKAQIDKASAISGLNALGANEARMAKIQAAAAQGQYNVIGLKTDAANPINKVEYEKASNFAMNYAAYITANNEAKRIAAEGMSSNPIEQQKRYEKAEASMQAAVRQMDATGAALSDPELLNVLTRIPSYWQVFGPKATINGGAKQLDDSTDALTDSYVARLRGLGLNHEINIKDDIAGEALTRYVLRHAETAKVVPNG